MAHLVQKCDHCLGKGVGLLVTDDQLCRYCASCLQRNYNPTDCAWAMKGYCDISPRSDGSILKKYIRDGEPGARVQEGCPTFVQYIGRLVDGSIFDTTRDKVDGKHVGGTDDPFEFILGRGKVVQGMDIGVATMNRGEIARFIIAPEYAYGEKGFAPKVEPHAVLDFEIELVSFGDPLPRFPSQEELAETRRKREAEERQQMIDHPPPTTVEKCRDAGKQRLKGNELVAQKQWESAKQEYDSGFVHLYVGKGEWEHVLSEEDRTTINEARLPLYLNRALCKLKLGKYDDAEWDCDKALEIEPDNVKGLYRRGVVLTEKLNLLLRKEARGEFWDTDKAMKLSISAEASFSRAKQLQPEQKSLDAGVTKLKSSQALLRKYQETYVSAQKALYKEKILDKMEEQNRKQHQRELANASDEVYTDMPGLE